MLNPELKLNPKLFDEEVEKSPVRNGFGEALMELGEKNQSVVVLTADLKESTRVEEFANTYPDRFIECGVAEQNMAGIASGLAVSGKIPFMSSYAAFSPGKNWETVRTTIVYNQANVKIAGHHAGLMTGADGSTHQATEDIAITRCLPGLQVYIPCDKIEAKKMTLLSARNQNPVYLRLSRDKSPIVTTTETPCDGKIYAYWITDQPQVTIFASGHLLWRALKAASELEKESIKVLVANVSCVSPLDVNGVVNLIKQTGCAVTVEDHQVAGGMGSAVAEVLAQNEPAPMEFVGLKNTFAESGTPDELFEKYGLGVKDIVLAVKKVVSRKKIRPL